MPTPGVFSHRIARWRWLMSFILVGFYPVFMSLLSRFMPIRDSDGPALPTSVRGLLFVLAFELGIFAIFWGIGWAFSRATKDELMLRWRGGVMPVVQGLGYALALRIGLGLVLVFVLVWIAMVTGMKKEQLEAFVKSLQPNTDSLFSKDALASPLYLLTVRTLLSFVVAGLREELWRTSCLAALRHLFPDNWNERVRWIAAIAISSVIFGLGHIYQGAMGVGITTFLGVGLGCITWNHRSIWPSVFAHGFIDATSFLAAAALAGKNPSVHVFFGWW